ncbi:hypothetical protein THAOC_15341 [Thalassiosira oceanica]|uniref:Uncharacterized protein n=1 Tax=Thalassiosira oceanica TaxID=159749 RepID=K0SCW3_THAOC|nr:hypothetical protein THAOC_15341 [Thalassiosira oceanica]|eukprot:EJK63973.1 hypothetical protein THAOC_15341 [Thalassiosira oceanica]
MTGGRGKHPISRPAEASDWARRVTRTFGRGEAGVSMQCPADGATAHRTQPHLRVLPRSIQVGASAPGPASPASQSCSSSAAAAAAASAAAYVRRFWVAPKALARTTISDVRNNTDTRKMGATTSSFTDAGREVTADGLELTGAERITLDPQQFMKKQCSDGSDISRGTGDGSDLSRGTGVLAVDE